MSIGLQELPEKPITRLYNFERSGKAYGRAISAQTEPGSSFDFDKAYGRVISAQTEPGSSFDFDEDTLILGPVQTRMPRGKSRRRLPGRRHRLLGVLSGLPKLLFKVKDTGKREVTPRKPPVAAVLQIYKGYVDAIHEGLAYLILESRNGQRLQIEWDAADLAKKSIEERQPFILKTVSIGNKFQYEFIPDQLRPLPGDMQLDIQKLLSYYRATGELDDDDK